MVERTQAERITALEVENRALKTEVQAMNSKLDQLLELKNKGLGAFWLVSIIGAVILSNLGNWLGAWLK